MSQKIAIIPNQRIATARRVKVNKYEIAGQSLLSEYNITIKTVRKSMSGVAYIEDRVISAPAPKSPISFAVFAHEVGHIANGNIKPRWLEELRAWEFSLSQFKRFGMAISKEVRQEFRWSMTYALAKALNRGMQKLPKELRPFKKYLAPITYIYGDGHKEQKWHADMWKVKHIT